MSTSPAPWKADLYDASHSFVWKAGASLLELLGVQPGERILDLGCGTGHLAAQMVAAGASVVGIDSSPEMIDAARVAYPQLHFEVADARQFSFAEPFDAIFSNAVLHWIKPPQAAIACMRAALKTGGRIVLEFGGHRNVEQIVNALAEQSPKFGVRFESPWYYPGIAEYSALLEGAGFEVAFAHLFDRPTPLDGEEGLRKWLEMFAGSVLNQLGAEDRQAMIAAVERQLRPVLYHNGAWMADYRRLRIAAQAVS